MYVYQSKKYVVDSEMTEERKVYLEEKEKLIMKRKKRKRIIVFSLVSVIFVVVVGYMYRNYFRPVKIDERIDKNSIHYATDLYYSDGKFYEKYLDDKQKKLYLDVFNDIRDVKTTTVIDCKDYGYEESGSCGAYLGLVIEVVLADHPDLFWYRTSRTEAFYINEKITMKHHFVSTNKIQLYFVERRLLRKIDELANEFDDLETDYDKAKAVYDWLGKNKSYSNLITRKDGTAWSALLESNTVCAGYAAASQLLFQRMGMESMLVSGNTSGPHAWNFVYVEDGYYWFDATVGGSRGGESDSFYDGFLFESTSKYKLSLVDLNELQMGVKYLN